MSWGVEAKLYNFVQWAIQKLEADTPELTDEDEEDNYQELVVWVRGFRNQLITVGAACSGEMKGAMANTLLSVWDLKNNQPGENLRAGGVAAVHKALEDLLSGPLAKSTPPEPPAAPPRAKPDNIKSMGFQEAATYMWETLDAANRLPWGDGGFTLDMQRKGNYQGRDTCPNPLVSYVDESSNFFKSKTTQTFIALLDNYEREVGKAEVITAEEKQEMAAFLDALSKTEVIQFAFEWLKVHGKDSRTKKLRSMPDFMNLVYELWLAPYRRVRDNDSSGFEHVFVGEESRGKITGLHNWIQYYIEEKKGKIDYLGYKGRQDSDYSDDVHVVTVAFAWQDDDPNVETKPMSTILFGSTVEFEMAILTMAFLGGGEGEPAETPFQLGTENMVIKCFKQRCKGAPKIATAYMEIA